MNTERGRSEIGRLLAHWRAATGMTQEEVAEAASVSVRTVGNIERGAVRRPHLSTVRQIIAALRLTEGDARQFLAASRGWRGRGGRDTPAGRLATSDHPLEIRGPMPLWSPTS